MKNCGIKHFPQLSRSRPRRRRAVHFSRLFIGEPESSRLLFLGCRERPEGLFRGRSCFFRGLRPAGGWVPRPESGKNTGKSGQKTKNAESGHSRRFGVWCWISFFHREIGSLTAWIRTCHLGIYWPRMRCLSLCYFARAVAHSSSIAWMRAGLKSAGTSKSWLAIRSLTLSDFEGTPFAGTLA